MHNVSERPAKSEVLKVKVMFFNVVFSMFVCYSAAFCQLCFYNKDWIGLDWIRWCCAEEQCMSPLYFTSLIFYTFSFWLYGIVKFCMLCHGGYKRNKKAQLSLTNPRDAKACQKLLQFDVLTTLSLTILAYLHSFSC